MPDSASFASSPVSERTKDVEIRLGRCRGVVRRCKGTCAAHIQCYILSSTDTYSVLWVACTE